MPSSPLESEECFLCHRELKPDSPIYGHEDPVSKAVYPTCYWCYVGVTTPQEIESARRRALVKPLKVADGSVTAAKIQAGITLAGSAISPEPPKCPLCPERGLHVCYPRLIGGLKSDPGFRAFIAGQIEAVLKARNPMGGV